MEVKIGAVTLKLRRSTGRDGLQREMIAEWVGRGDTNRRGWGVVFGRCVTQTESYKGLEFHLEEARNGADDARAIFEQWLNLDETLLDEWYSAALNVNVAGNSALGPQPLAEGSEKNS